jgi:hypothetical protein
MLIRKERLTLNPVLFDALNPRLASPLVFSVEGCVYRRYIYRWEPVFAAGAGAAYSFVAADELTRRLARDSS